MDLCSIKYAVAACAGELIQGSPEAQVGRACTDSRQVRRGDLFFALSGETFDGHDFLESAAQAGAVAVVVAREKIPAGLACGVIAVDEPRRALGRMGARYRRDFDPVTVAVAGSNGKTSTKNLIASVVRQKLETLWSESSFNNDVGVPLTLLRLERKHAAAVFEVGTNHPGELAPLVRMVAPRIGVITSIAREHLEFFGGLAGVAEEEGVLAELLPADGRLFLSGDSEWSEAIARRSHAPAVRAGFGGTNDWRASNVRPDEQGSRFWVDAPKFGYSGEYQINLLGRHQVGNALYAIAVGAELGLSNAQIQKGLAECQPGKMRLQLWEANGIRVLEDTYNANADSMLAALRTLRELPAAGGRKIAVLGDMSELGAHSLAAHEEVGRAAAEPGLDQLFTFGPLAAGLAETARSAGMENVAAFPDLESASPAVREYLRPGDLVLLKASRSMRLERLAAELRSPVAAAAV